MENELRKDQTRRPRGKCKSVPKSDSARTSKNAALDAALKMFAEFNRDKARTKTGMKTSRVRSDSNGSKASDGDSGGSSTGNQNPQISPSYKVSICPVKRPVSSIEMGIPIV